MKNGLLNKIIVFFIALFLIVTTVIVAVLMIMPSNRTAVLSELELEGEKIIHQAQAWVQTEMEEARLDTLAPFKTLRFDKFGYMDGLNISGRVHNNKTGYFTLDISNNGSTFDLTARGSDDLSLVWKNIHLNEIPKPEIP